MTNDQMSAQIRDNVKPVLEEVDRLAAAAAGSVRTIPVYREVFADMETPVSVYLKLTDGAKLPGFVLESVEGGTHIARYSFIGADTGSSITMRDGILETTGDLIQAPTSYDDPLQAVESLIQPFRTEASPDLPRFTGGAVGYLSYDAVRRFEPRVPAPGGAGLGLPEARFHVVDTLVVFDHLERMLKVVSHVHIGDSRDVHTEYLEAVRRIDDVSQRLAAPVPTYVSNVESPAGTVADRSTPNMPPERFRQMVEQAKKYIRQGDVFQVVPSQRVDVQTPAHPFSVYRALRMVNPSPYMFYLDFADHQIVGASPELLVRLEGETVSNHPIAGTRPRGSDEEEDQRLAQELIGDAKERAEHIMLVDLGRNDIGRVSKPGTVRVSKLMDIERFSHVMHIVSNVDGTIRDDYSAGDALRACFPAGTVSGAPKVRAMEIISELEPDSRGVYAGAVGYLDFSGEMDTCIALRTLVYKDGVASLQAGGGVVADSSPDGEYQESLHKMRALVRAIERAEEMEQMFATVQGEGTL